MFHQQSRCNLHKFESYEHCTATETFHVLLNVPMRLSSPLARLLTRCACFVIVTCSCRHKSVGLHNIVLERGVGTHHFVPFLCSGFDLVSCSLGCTAVPGPELMTDSDSWAEQCKDGQSWVFVGLEVEHDSVDQSTECDGILLLASSRTNTCIGPLDLASHCLTALLPDEGHSLVPLCFELSLVLHVLGHFSIGYRFCDGACIASRVSGHARHSMLSMCALLSFLTLLSVLRLPRLDLSDQIRAPPRSGWPL